MQVVSFLLLFFFSLGKSYSQELSLPLSLNRFNTIQNFLWNGTTPLSLPKEIGENYDLFLIYKGQKHPFIKTKLKDIENNPSYFYQLENPFLITNENSIRIQVQQKNSSSIFNKKTYTVKLKRETPLIKLISASETITHGGGGVVVLQSDEARKLEFIALIDSGKIPYYPNTFIKDGFYSLIFPWYTDLKANEWDKFKIVVMDKFGNTNSLPLSMIKAKNFSFRQSTITLPDNYAQQKAKELALDNETSKKLEGDIAEINKHLSQQPTFNRWQGTRTDFQSSIKQKVISSKIFPDPSIPLKNARITATYGDQRKYYYLNKLSRTSVHRGVDFASTKNAPIYAILGGTVIYSDWYSGNGKSIIIDHGLNIFSLYAHNSELLVQEGSYVKSGEQIAVSGTTGQSTGDHLHLSVIAQGVYLEPMEWISKEKIETIYQFPLKKAELLIQDMEMPSSQ